MILAIAEHGQIRVSTWLIDSNLPFRANLPEELIEPLEKAAEQEAARGRKVKPLVEIPEDLQSLFRERWRVQRAITVISTVNKALDKPEKKEKRRKRKTVEPQIEVEDENGFLKLPVSLGKSGRLMCLGTLVPGQPAFQCRATPFPIGFCTERTYRHPDWTAKVPFRSEILDGGGRPLFVVTRLSESEERFVANDPSEAWRMAIESADGEMRKKELETRLDPDSGKKLGNTLFFLVHKKVVQELCKMEDANQFAGLVRANARMTRDQWRSEPFEIPVPLFSE
jgi:hypothetical protein